MTAAKFKNSGMTPNLLTNMEKTIILHLTLDTIKQNRLIGDCVLRVNCINHHGIKHYGVAQNEFLCNKSLDKFLRKKFPNLHCHIEKLYTHDHVSVEKIGDGFEAVLGWMFTESPKILKRLAVRFLNVYFEWVDNDSMKKSQMSQMKKKKKKSQMKNQRKTVKSQMKKKKKNQMNSQMKKQKKSQMK